MRHDKYGQNDSQPTVTPSRYISTGENGLPGSPTQSDLPQTPDSNGSSNSSSIYHLRQQSSEKLRLAWESIYDKFRDSHLEAQDEIYLGRRSVKGDRMRVIRDRGHLRSLPKTKLEFGCFHIEEADLIGYINAETGSNEDTNSDCGKNVVQPDSSPFHDRKDVASPSHDPDLKEFLQAEAKRRELCPTDSEDEDDHRRKMEDKMKIEKRKAKRKLSSSTTKQSSRRAELSTCHGPDQCSKSICMFCGGFQKVKRARQETEPDTQSVL